MASKPKFTFRMQQVCCILLAIVLLFCGCGQDTPGPENTTVSKTEPPAPVEPDLGDVKQWLKKDFSFTLSYQYTNLGINGMSQETTQTFAADGSWSFINERKIWDHTANYESQENAEFYYLYEDSQLICYSSIDGSALQRTVVSSREKKEMDDSKAYIVGSPALLPKYLKNLCVTQENTVTVFTFELPVDKVLADSTFLSVFVNNAFILAGQEYKDEYQAVILCTLETDSQTLQPKSLSYDFSQIKPYILSSGAQSGEYALDSDFVTMVYSFDFNLRETTEIPGHLIA